MPCEIRPYLAAKVGGRPRRLLQAEGVEKVLRGQVQRMMRDPRARSLADGFAAQWLGIRPLGATIRPDAKLFPEFFNLGARQ